MKSLTLGFVFSLIYGLSDTILVNYFGFFLDNYLPRYTTQFNNGYILGFMRNRSLFTEPGIFALFINIIAPFVMFYLKYNTSNFKYYVFSITLFLSFMLTFSVAGIFVLFIVLILVNFSPKIKNLLFVFSFILSTILVIYYSNARVVKVLFDKVTLKTSSGGDRLERLIFFKNTIYESLNNPELFLFGHGVGWIRSNFSHGGVVNTFAELFIEHGVLSLIVLTSFYVILFFKYKIYINKCLLFIFIAIPLQLFFTSEYSHCFVIFSFNFMIFICVNSKKFILNKYLLSH